MEKRPFKLITLNRYNWTGGCEKHPSYIWRRCFCFQCYLFFILPIEGFFSRSPFMVLTLETHVQRELQTGTGVFSRFKADLNIRFKVQQLPELCFIGALMASTTDRSSCEKSPRFIWYAGNCIYFLSGIPHTRNCPLHMESKYKNSCETPYIFSIIHI